MERVKLFLYATTVLAASSFGGAAQAEDWKVTGEFGWFGVGKAQEIEKGTDLAWRQHARRLVQDEDVGIAIEQLQDFDALLTTHG